MAHGDYHCCAVCNRKLDYAGSESRTKEDICSDCLKGLRAAGIPVVAVDELIAWIATTDAEAVTAKLAEVGFKECFYGNPVDAAYRAKTGVI